jgi:hypothetical protein
MRSTMYAAISAALVIAMPALADDDDYMLDITRIEVELGHHMQFREGVKAYMACYDEADGENGWSAWRSMDGDGIVYHVVSRLDSWGELDETDEAGMSCWPVIEEKVAPHMASAHTMYAKRMPDWSASIDDDEETVVRLYNFRVDDFEKFRAAVGSVTGIMKAAEYEHMGTWYDVQGGGMDDPDYFVVESFKNFADMDNERAGPYKTTVEHAGEESADLVWGQFRASLEADWSAWSSLLRYDKELSYSDDD